MNDQKFCKKCEEELIDKIPACPLQCQSPKCKAYMRKPKIDYSRKPIVWIIGGPGAGKGTQCEKIISKYGYTHISTGDLLREEIKKGGDHKKCLENALEHGALVPTDIVLSLVLKAMESRANNVRGFLIDGYPREKSQAHAFEKVINPPNLVIYLEASHDTLFNRLMHRAAHSDRIDDNEETIKLRLDTFYANNTAVMHQHWDKICKINAERHPDEVFADVQKALDSLVVSGQSVDEEGPC